MVEHYNLLADVFKGLRVGLFYLFFCILPGRGGSLFLVIPECNYRAELAKIFPKKTTDSYILRFRKLT